MRAADKNTNVVRFFHRQIRTATTEVLLVELSLVPVVHIREEECTLVAEFSNPRNSNINKRKYYTTSARVISIVR